MGAHARADGGVEMVAKRHQSQAFVALSGALRAELVALAAAETRTLGNMIVRLITEALAARKAKEG